MPYITFSRKLAHNAATVKASTYLSSLFGNSVVERRGAKSVKKVIERSHSKGFSKVIIISENKRPKELDLNLLISSTPTKSFKWLGAYAIKVSGKKNKIIDADGNEATDRLVEKASE
ncbi:MAG: hypothetical protein ACREBW_02590 [Candidatus Micrarchaeaceae archaeon]